MNARFYVPYTNRHLTPDTIIPDEQNSQSWNRYSYVHNNPTNLIDPTGHYGCSEGGYLEEACEQEPIPYYDDPSLVPDANYIRFMFGVDVPAFVAGIEGAIGVEVVWDNDETAMFFINEMGVRVGLSPDLLTLNEYTDLLGGSVIIGQYYNVDQSVSLLDALDGASVSESHTFDYRQWSFTAGTSAEATIYDNGYVESEIDINPIDRRRTWSTSFAINTPSDTFKISRNGAITYNTPIGNQRRQWNTRR